ncbi:MAG: DUF72 domain-containing protein [Chloroflexi bacterium]|nr:DUF72 domain-containing protein [Chloroflexota bacterium]
MKSLKVGLCGWRRLQDFYPPRTRPADMLAYYSKHFPLVEISTTFQGIPSSDRVREWATSVEPGFTFDVVAFGGLTLHQLRPGASPGSAKSSWTDLAVEPPEVIFDAFAESISPLAENDLLGLLILQFPPWFEAGESGLDYLARCRSEFDGMRLAVEFRNESWIEPADRLETTLERLIDLEIALSASDFPDAGDLAPELAAHVSVAEFGSMRLHGRAAGAWDRVGPGGDYAAEYSYSDDDLNALVPVLQSLDAEVDELHVSFNVAPADGAVESSKRLLELIDEAEREPDYTQWRPPRDLT